MVEWKKRLADAGYRITEARCVVMQVLTEAEMPLSPQEIVERGAQIHPGLGLATVYRTVSLLEELGLARRVHRKDDCHGYVLASPGHRHHIICRRCGQAVEFLGSEALNALMSRVEKSTDYCVDGHLLQLFGLCPDCREEGD